MDELRVTGTSKPMVLSFDGRVIEVFGRGATRYHLELMSPLELAPGKHGHQLTVGDVAGSQVQLIPIDDADLPGAEAFVSRVNAAIDAAGGAFPVS
jgi:hypothetical protein